MKLNWVITDETKKNDTILLQKATLDFGGRNWVAWFNKNIPIAEGPYKFNKLPGLIFEINDAENSYSFQLTKIEKLTKSTKRYIENYSKLKIISWNDYNNIMLKTMSDPYMLEGRNPLEGVMPGSLTIDGVKVNTIDDFNRVIKRRVQLQKEACNDFLEKDRFKFN